MSYPPVGSEEIKALVELFLDEMVALRRDLHANPEPSQAEVRTTALVAERLRAAGLKPKFLDGTGLICDLDGTSRTRTGRLGIRADMDSLPMDDLCGCAWQSTKPGYAHACGHDVHTAIALGTGLVLAELAKNGLLKNPVRLIFQPAEENMFGAHDLLRQGVLTGVDQIVALHCEPKLDVGLIGTRIGPITSASDSVSVTVSSSGGHTSRPHLTGDVVYALGQVITQVPGVLGRRLDPRSGVNLTWGMVSAGHAHNAIPSTGTVAGTLRCLDVRAWERAGQLLDEAVSQVVAPYAVDMTINHVRGVPPVDNDEVVTKDLEAAARAVVGPGGVVLTDQSLGGEDFAWYLTKVPGAMVRLGTGTPGAQRYDLHRGDLVVNEGAIEIGIRLLAGLAAEVSVPED